MKPKERTLHLKYEEPGYVSPDPPACKTCVTLDMGKILGALRVVSLVREFVHQNRAWLKQLTAKVRVPIRLMPQELRTENGEDFLRDSFEDTAWAYAIIQAMMPGKRWDPKHFDGGASELHMGLTIFGRRRLDLFLPDGTTVQMPQELGSIYVGNLCAVEHQVSHYDSSEAGVLYEHGRSPGIEVAIMLRCDVFRHLRARKLKGRPTPIDVYNAVNEIVAQHIAEEPLRLPVFADVVSRHEATLASVNTESENKGAKKRRRMEM